MNAKKAKKLRKMVRAVVTSQPGQQVTDVAYQENERRRKYALVNVALGDEPKKERVQVAPGTVTVVPITVKGLYKRLKKSYTAGRIKAQ